MRKSESESGCESSSNGRQEARQTEREKGRTDERVDCRGSRRSFTALDYTREAHGVKRKTTERTKGGTGVELRFRVVSVPAICIVCFIYLFTFHSFIRPNPLFTLLLVSVPSPAAKLVVPSLSSQTR